MKQRRGLGDGLTFRTQGDCRSGRILAGRDGSGGTGGFRDGDEERMKKMKKDKIPDQYRISAGIYLGCKMM